MMIIFVCKHKYIRVYVGIKPFVLHCVLAARLLDDKLNEHEGEQNYNLLND